MSVKLFKVKWETQETHSHPPVYHQGWVIGFVETGAVIREGVKKLVVVPLHKLTIVAEA